jgi:hypothetical protein
MREGFDAPVLHLTDEDVRDLCEFFDGQDRIKLAVWVRHEQRGVDGPVYDHHLVLGMDDVDYASADLWALELGLPLPGLRFSEPRWLDIFPCSEVEALRTFAAVVWEYDSETSTGDDPLNYRLTWEPYEVDSDAVAKLAELLRPEPGIRRVEATHERLWKGEIEERASVGLYIDAEPTVRDALSIATEAARNVGLLVTPNHSATLGLPRDERVHTATLYEAAA